MSAHGTVIPAWSFREPAGRAWHGAALLYAAGAFALGWLGLLGGGAPAWLPATLLLAHGMVIAAYLVHECAHNTIFARNADNARLGAWLTWICGACYGSYEDIRYKHFRHHVDVDDRVWFEYRVFFAGHPRVRRAVELLEWCYIPAHDLLMHGILMFGAFIVPGRAGQRARNLRVLAVRGALFGLLLWLAPHAALLYLVACMLMIHVLRFMDMVQHDYGPNPVLLAKSTSPHRGDFAYEQAHTFSNPLSFRTSWVNWLTLNFGWHNAHHARPVTPWYRLPALHRELFGDDPGRVVPLSAQLRIYHRYRVARVAHDEVPEPEGPAYLQACRAAATSGGNAASFLTAF